MPEDIAFDKIENRPIVPGSMMDEEHKMKIPLIDLDIEEMVNTVLEITDGRAGGRKTVCCTFRGMGGGKTRALEEMRRVMLLRPGVFVLGITYNCRFERSVEQCP